MASAGPAMLVGVIYLVGAAFWRSAVMFALGAWLCLVVAVGSISGFPASPGRYRQVRRGNHNRAHHGRPCGMTEIQGGTAGSAGHGPTIPPEIDEAIVEVQSFLHLDSYLRRML